MTTAIITARRFNDRTVLPRQLGTSRYFHLFADGDYTIPPRSRIIIQTGIVLDIDDEFRVSMITAELDGTDIDWFNIIPGQPSNRNRIILPIENLYDDTEIRIEHGTPVCLMRVGRLNCEEDRRPINICIVEYLVE